MDGAPFDPRVISNLMLDESDSQGITISNLALQKLLYFAHAICLIENKKKLVTGYFEAWKFGPVHPIAYAAFQSAGARPINTRAMKTDPITGKKIELRSPDNRQLFDFISRIISTYGRASPKHLVDISHAKGAPWDVVVEKAQTSIAFGMRIHDDLIIERFKFHKVAVVTALAVGETYEDHPLAGN
jgi:uncharacterized phage-associated protein